MSSIASTSRTIESSSRFALRIARAGGAAPYLFDHILDPGLRVNGLPVGAGSEIPVGEGFGYQRVLLRKLGEVFVKAALIGFVTCARVVGDQTGGPLESLRA